jgi:hypothetical protein
MDIARACARGRGVTQLWGRAPRARPRYVNFVGGGRAIRRSTSEFFGVIRVGRRR